MPRKLRRILRTIRDQLRRFRPRRHSVFDEEIYTVWGAVSEDEFLLRQMVKQIEPGDVVVDVGAHTGSYTLALAAKGAQVYAVEPNPLVFDKLIANVCSNGFDTVECLNVGLGAEIGEADLYISSSVGRTSFERHYASKAGEDVTDVRLVDILPLDELLESGRILPPDHLKIDVEGAGLEVLRGAEATIRRHRPRIYIEPHTDIQREAAFTEQIENLGYEIHKSSYRWVCVPANSSRDHNQTPS